MKFAAALAAFLVAAPALAQSSQPNDCLENRRIGCAPRIRVIDGDTFDMNGEIIRL